MPDQDRIKRLEIFLYIILVVSILSAVGMLMLIQQINKSFIEIKKFCWGEKIINSVVGNETQPHINIIQ
jgi:hypothetical protein